MSTLHLLRSLTLLCCLSGMTLAQDWAKPRLEKSPRHLEWVTVRHGNREVRCWVAYPEIKEKATAVVIIHEIFGLTDWVRGVADQLAEAGYIVIAPDLLSGTGPNGAALNRLAGLMVPAQDRITASRPGDRRPESCQRLRPETPRLQWQGGRRRLLLGWHPNLSLHEPARRSEGRLRILWLGHRRRARIGQDPSPCLRFLRRKRCTG